MPYPRRDQRGLSESVQYAVIFPVLMLVTLGIIQAGIWIHGHHVAIRAANAAVDAARGSYGDNGEARELGGDLATAGGLKNVSVSVAKGAATVDVTVRGEAPLVFDVGLGRITETASAPLERVTTP